MGLVILDRVVISVMLLNNDNLKTISKKTVLDYFVTIQLFNEVNLVKVAGIWEVVEVSGFKVGTDVVIVQIQEEKDIVRKKTFLSINEDLIFKN